MATAVLAVAPGPDNIYVMMQSMVNGKKYGMATVAGLLSGCIVHTTLLAFGVSAVIKESETLFFALKLFGALYLFYLAYKVFKSPPAISIDGVAAPKKKGIALFKQGFIMNVVNPKVAIFFLAFFPGFLFSQELHTAVQFYILGLLFIVVSLVIFTAIAFLSGAISNSIKKYKQVGVYLKWMQIIVFAGIGIYVLVSKK